MVRGKTSSLAKSKQIICAHFQMLFSTIFLFFDVPHYLILLRTYGEQFTLTTKKSLHIIFKQSLCSMFLIFLQRFDKVLIFSAKSHH